MSDLQALAVRPFRLLIAHTAIPRITALGVLGFLVVAACSPVTMLNLLAPEHGIVCHAAIPYGDGPRHKLDVYAPSAPPPGTPVVVFFYGGGWASGERGMYRFVGAELAAHGIIAVIPDYRLYPEVRFPSFVEDGAAAVAWAHAHAAEFGGDPQRLFLMGHSAGAEIATLLALDGSYLNAEGLDPRGIAGVIGLAGPYDFLPLHTAQLKDIFSAENAEYPRSQPIAYVTAAAPPMLLAAPVEEDTVDPGNTDRLAARLRAAGRPVTVIHYPGIGHKEMIGAIARPLSFLAPVLRDTLNFIAAAGAPDG